MYVVGTGCALQPDAKTTTRQRIGREAKIVVGVALEASAMVFRSRGFVLLGLRHPTARHWRRADPDWRNAMHLYKEPEEMTSEERFREVARILAIGCLRLARSNVITAEITVDCANKDLDCSGHRSVHDDDD